MKHLRKFNESLAYNWQEFIGRKLPDGAEELLKQEQCGEYLRTWRRAYFHDDETDYRNWIIAGYAPGIAVGKRYCLYFHMSARQPHYPGHNFSDTTGVECYRTIDEMNAALDGYLSGVIYKGL